MRVKDKVAIVTGATSGIGEACARHLAAEGAAVLVTGRQDERGESIATAIREGGGRARFHHLDVTDESQWDDALAFAEKSFGAGLHVLVNNSGVGRSAPLLETTVDHFRLLMRVNAEAMFIGMQRAIPLIERSGGGSIINVSSTASNKAFPNQSAYCASKAAVKQMTKVAALEFAARNIRVNSVHPGVIQTPAWGNIKHSNPNELAKARVPLGYMGAPDDIAYAVVYLASDESRYVTGAEMVIDGGLTAG